MFRFCENNKRTIESLKPMIVSRAAPGASIYTDCWKAYPAIAKELELDHFKVDIISDKIQKMSEPFHMLSGLGLPYNHYKFLKCGIRDAKGKLEQVCRGIHDHGRLFPRDEANRRYLDSFAQQISYLEEEVESWREWALRMPPHIARQEVYNLTNQIFRLTTKMGPAAEAQHYAVLPVWNPPLAPSFLDQGQEI